jgi:hypothetical protein
VLVALRLGAQSINRKDEFDAAVELAKMFPWVSILQEDEGRGFPFGHGLSYTKFEMKDLNVKDVGVEIVTAVSVMNMGAMDGEEVVQVYISRRNPSVNRPVKELKAFEKVVLKQVRTKG